MDHPPVSDVGKMYDSGSLAQVLKVLEYELTVDFDICQWLTAKERVQRDKSIILL